jgi:hypothetical protein
MPPDAPCLAPAVERIKAFIANVMHDDDLVRQLEVAPPPE